MNCDVFATATATGDMVAVGRASGGGMLHVHARSDWSGVVTGRARGGGDRGRTR